MNKKFYLGAILLATMTLSTGALTSCIDNDEPEGITNLRGAKAELLRAKAALELANAETAKQTANLIAAQAKVQEALAAQEQAKVKFYEAEAAIKAAESEEAKAAAELAKEQAKLEAEKAKAEAEAHITLQKQLQAQYQLTLEQALRDIETAKAVLTDAQQAKLNALEQELSKKYFAYKSALSSLLVCQEQLFNTVNGDNKYIAKLEKNVEEAKAQLAKVNASYESLKALAENAEITAWEKELNEINEYVGENSTNKITFNDTKYQVGDGKASVEAAEIALAGEKALAGATEEKKQYEDDRDAYIQAQQYYNYLADPTDYYDYFFPASTDEDIKDDCFDDCGESWYNKYGNYGKEGEATTHDPSKFEEVEEPKTYTIPGHEFKVENSHLAKTPGVGETKEFAKQEKPYCVIKTAFAEKIDDDKLLDDLRNYKENVANFKVTAEQIEADNCIPTKKEWTVDAAQKAYDKAVELFVNMHKQYQTGEVVSVVSTAKVDAAVAEYNKAYEALKAAVEAANKTYDDQAANVKSVLEAKTTAVYEKIIADKKFKAQKDAAATWLSNTANSGVVINITGCATIAEIEATIQANNSAIKAANSQLDAAIVIAKLKKDKSFVNAYDDWLSKKYPTKAERDAAEEGWKKDAANDPEVKKAYDDADAARNKANAAAQAAIDAAIISKDGKTGVEPMFEKVKAAFKEYKDEATGYAQKLKADANFENLRGFKNAKGEANKYAQVDDEKDKPSGDISGYVVPAVKLDKDGKKYEAVEGHVALTVPAMDTKAVATALTLVVDKDEVYDAWEKASNAAFGYLRHTALTEDLLQEFDVVLNITNPGNSDVTIVDENGKAYDKNTYVRSDNALAKLLIAKKIVESHEELAKAGEAAAELLKEIEAYEQEIKDVIAPITAAVEKAAEEVEAAKAAHIASYNAYKSIAKEYVAQLKEIEAKVAGQKTVMEALSQIISAYYKNTEFVYIDLDGNEQTITFDNAEHLTQIVNDGLKWFEDEFRGIIVLTEKDLADAEQTLWEATNNDDFDAVAQAKQAVEKAQANVDLTKSYYDYALAQLQKYLEALSK